VSARHKTLRSESGAEETPEWGLADYELLREIGRGASGAVYLCKERPNGRRVAVKRLLSPSPGGSSSRRFQREERILTGLEHPGIVRAERFVHAGGEMWLVLEYVPGPTLRELLAVAPLAEPDALEVLRQLATALDYAHRCRVVHRDLKPENVLVTPAGQCKLADFGIAKLIAGTHTGSLGSFRTRTGTILGTAQYISPEAAAGTVRLDQRADLYGLGVIAYEMLVGHPPFPAGTDPLATLEAHISQPAPLPTDLNADFPEPVEEVLLRALAKRPRQRQRTVASLWNELDRAASTAWPDWYERADLGAVVASRQPRLDRFRLPDGQTLQGTAAQGVVWPDPSLRQVEMPVFLPRRRRKWLPLLGAAAAGVFAAIILVLLAHMGA
jgi:eukaryotic-like serine/threonine-protein kinase